MLWISLRYAVTPQCVERFHRYRSYEKKIIACLLKFVVYIPNHKILPGNIFGLILKNKMAATGIFSTFSKDFSWPSRAKGIIGRDLKIAGYVPHYEILTGNIFGLILKNKKAAMGVSLSVMKSAYYVHPPGGWIYYFCFFRRPMSDVRRPASGVRCPASRMVSAHLKEKY